MVSCISLGRHVRTPGGSHDAARDRRGNEVAAGVFLHGSRMSRTQALDRLCERYHIAPAYRDIWGNRHEVSEETQRALLGAMGVATDSDEHMQQALERVEVEDWGRPLPPVHVAREGEDCIRLEIAVRADRAGHGHRWTLTEEDGGRREGRFRPADLQQEGQRMLDGQAWERRVLPLPDARSGGYHRLELQDLEMPDAGIASMSLIVVPADCYRPQAVSGGQRVWGLNIALYALRSTRNWGIGDFTDLTRVVEFAAAAGAGLVGLNPLHALFLHNPDHASPYSPSSRQFLNVLYLDVEALADFAECDAAQHQVRDRVFQERLDRLRRSELVDYPGVAGVKMTVLETLYRHFRQEHLQRGDERAEAFARFRRSRGDALRLHALYEAIQESLHRADPAVWGWPAWPKSYRHPKSGAVAAFAAQNAKRMGFYEYLQWQAHVQLQTVGHRAFELDLGLGLYQDIAVSVDVGGAEVWANQELYVLEGRIGSPPDDFNLEGQDWGLPPWNPEMLRDRGYAPFIKTLRENMSTAGVVRLDHVMSLMRLFWVPSGMSPREGGYVSYPFQDLLGILALESQRNRCLVVGEDLGTVPEEVREALRPMGVLSYRLLYFEKADDGNFRTPADVATQALIATSTHDLPTLSGYWEGLDLALRDRLHLFPTDKHREDQVIGRAEDRARLLVALEKEGLLPAGLSVQAVPEGEMTVDLAVSIHRFLARTPAMVMMAQMEDVLGQREQINLPGTTDERPNWRHKLGLGLEQWEREPRVLAILSALTEERAAIT